MTINETDIDASDVKIQVYAHSQIGEDRQLVCTLPINDVCGAIRWHSELPKTRRVEEGAEVEYLVDERWEMVREDDEGCLLYTSPSPRDGLLSRMPSSA